MKKFNIDWDLITAIVLSFSLPAAIAFGALFPYFFYQYN
jgi:hypothetical protein